LQYGKPFREFAPRSGRERIVRRQRLRNHRPSGGFPRHCGKGLWVCGNIIGLLLQKEKLAFSHKDPPLSARAHQARDGGRLAGDPAGAGFR